MRKSARRLRAVGPARAGGADRTGSIMDQRGWAYGIGVLRRFCLDRLDNVATARVLVIDLFLFGWRKLVQHRARDSPAGYRGKRPDAGKRRDHVADLAAILLATTIFWAYVEFMQFLIIWEENLKSEIPWYLLRNPESGGQPPYLDRFWLYRAVFRADMAAKQTQPRRRSGYLPADHHQPPRRQMVAGAAGVCPSRPVLADVAAILALGGPMVLLFGSALRYGPRLSPSGWPMWKAANHG